MAPTNQIDYLMTDLGTIDDFFQKCNYHRWGDNVKSHREGLQKGFEFLDKYPCEPKFPTLLYTNLLTYCEEAEVGRGGKRFFVTVELWGGEPNAYGYLYNIAIRTFHDKVEQPSDIERLDRYFTTPIGHRENQPIQKMLKELEKLL